MLLLGFFFVLGNEVQGQMLCAYYHSNSQLSILFSSEEPSPRTPSVSGLQVNTTACRKSSNACYTFWKEPDEILSQGCWESSSQIDCQRSACVSAPKSAFSSSPLSHFCCCTGHLCNLRVAVDTTLVTEPPLQIHHSLSQTVVVTESSGSWLQITVIVASVAIAVAAVVSSGVFVFQTCVKGDHRKPPCTLQQQQQQPLISGSCPQDALDLISIAGQGRYGTVWKASLGDSHVAVKIFGPSSRSYYYNEVELYSLAYLQHPNIVGFLGCQEVLSVDGQAECRLILEYAPFGCLQDYLRNNSIDWNTLCKMGGSIARGLAHLHNDYQGTDDGKLCIAHRDINSRNVLVKTDLTCCLCDLGFAMRISGAHYYQNGQELHAETTSLCDVGTLRYMAPEVLEGAVNLRECESSLKQIDVYSLGLVLWEIAYRCRELYPSKEAPPYQLPFEAEIGAHPTQDQMKTLVCRHKARPLLPESWRDVCVSERLLKATLEDAWDQDAEARLTSLCVEQRLAELSGLWHRQQRFKLVNPALQANVSVVTGAAESSEAQPVTAVAASSVMVSEAPRSVVKNNALGAWPPSPRPLQPHQGRNPCLERNTCTPTRELSVSGNALVDRSNKHRRDAVAATNLAPAANASSGAQGVVVNYARVINPIPYVQNAVRAGHAATPPPVTANADTEVGGRARLASFLSNLLHPKDSRRREADHGTRPQREEGRGQPQQQQQPLFTGTDSPAPSDVENPPTLVVKTVNKSNVATPKATQICWVEQGTPNVSLIKSPNVELPETKSTAIRGCDIPTSTSAVSTEFFQASTC